MANILLVEDKCDIARLVIDGLIEAGHCVEHADRGETGLDLSRRGRHDLLIVDRMLPGMDGLSMVRALREEIAGLPVLMLSSLGSIEARIEGFQAGCDDYLVKPFALNELVARVEALLRWMPENPSLLRVGDIEVDLITRQVSRAGRKVDLLPREFALLEYLMRHPDQLATRTMLLEEVWNYRFDPWTNIIETHVSRLRAKLGHDAITTVRNSGYLMRSAGAAE